MKKFRINIFFFIIVLVFIVIVVGLIYKINSVSKNQNIDSDKSAKARQFSTNYYEYSVENFKKASMNGKTVLFFATNWCSTCTELDRELINESEKLDEGITILKIDFDKDKKFKKDYKVLTQHTLVQVDVRGVEIAKWVGGDIEQINKEVK